MALKFKMVCRPHIDCLMGDGVHRGPPHSPPPPRPLLTRTTAEKNTFHYYISLHKGCTDYRVTNAIKLCMYGHSMDVK